MPWWDFTEQPYPGCIRAPGAGLIRDDMTPKPAYHALKRLIKGRWWTRATAAVGARGEARFRGFFGHYDVTATVGGRTLTGGFSFEQEGGRPIRVPLKRRPATD